jgi:maltose O-acetyltransferase
MGILEMSQQIINQGCIHISMGNLRENSYIHHSCYIEIPNNIFIGNNVRIPKNTDMKGMGKIYIGDNVLVRPNVCFFTNRHSYEKYDEAINNQSCTQGSITIKQNSWIGGNVILLPNVIVGEHCVIGAGSVVTKNVPDYSVAVGNPAKIIKKILK